MVLKILVNSNFPLRIHLTTFYIENVITSLDFNPKEELVATIDRYGTCRISEMNTENYSFHLALEMSRDKGGKIFYDLSSFRPKLGILVLLLFIIY